MTGKGFPQGRRAARWLVICVLLAAGLASGRVASAQTPPAGVELAPVQTGTVRRVMILFTDRIETPSHQLIDRGLRSTLTASSVGNLQIYPEYLDVTRFPRDGNYPHVD